MSELPDFEIAYTFSSDGLAELDRQLSLLLATREGTMPLDRDFGLDMSFLDLPPETAKSLLTAEVTKKVAQYLPSCRVKEVTFEPGEAGTLKPRVVITNA